MNAKTYAERTKPYRGTVALSLVEQWVHTNDLIRPCYTTGSGRWTKNSDHADLVRHILSTALGLTYDHGNDAPRGGGTGQWIKPHGWGKMKPVRDQWIKEQEENQRKEELKEQARLRAQAAYYADKLHDHHAVLVAWWEAREYHPAPGPVIAAKHASGLTWKQVRTYCKAHTSK
jgi:hypothetical protein